MGLRGPKPKPSAILKLTGSRKLQNRKNEPQPEPLYDIPACPDFLQGIAREFWQDHIRRLVSLGVVTALDLPAFAGLCRQWQMWREAEAELKAATDRMQVAETGYQAVGAWETLANKRWQLFSKACAEFGMTPSARTSVSAVPRKTGDVVDKRDAFYQRKAK